ncbi:TadE/TadG family type IV pilus assembly protein [Qipengyuania sphaerica]|uniref:TadE/TadG family type IV pilus assembly protein n=1 Tax=Qipengyuania sphaerica TaxID=2867243 RepID=UPI001C8758E9|nr:Tad domain-containing protein [Qipengyuania sphaerica]MBX7541290.1 Tad domain-containing protein [Qipengyuania sphaerica]
MKAIKTKRFVGDESGAVAATYALALIPLIAFAGIAMDYARLMGMDSELQNGADQAALAGASQLDGRTGACSRAAAAASAMLTNKAILASDDDTISLPNEGVCDAVGQIRFWQDKAKTTAATNDDNANYIEVGVDLRTVDYALMPITGLISSPQIRGVALAGMGSAICKLPPIMMCNPNEPGSLEFPVENYVGYGVRLIANDGGGYVPGNFGYLETDAGNGAIATARTLGRTEVPGDCTATDDVTTKPGEQISVLDALNTRHGIYANGLNNVCGQGDGLCPPSGNARIDLLKNQGNNCSISNAGFQVGPNPYRPTTTGAYNPATLDPMGYPRDKCHAVSVTGVCGSFIGNADWDRTNYFRSNAHVWPGGTMPLNNNWGNYGYTELLTVPQNTPTRYQVYRFEAANNKLGSQAVGNLTAQGAPLCPTPTGAIPPGSAPDRRVLSIAVINCLDQNVRGKTEDVQVKEWVDVFLVEPSARRGNGASLVTEASDVYVEIIGRSTLGGGADRGQEIRKDVPYLVE